MESKSSGVAAELVSGISQFLSCVGWMVLGGFAGSLACMMALILLDVSVLNPDGPQTGQLGMLGPFIGGPVGAVAGLVFAGIQSGRRQTDAEQVSSKTTPQGD